MGAAPLHPERARAARCCTRHPHEEAAAAEEEEEEAEEEEAEEPVEGRFYAGPPPSAAVAYVNTWSPLDDCDASNGTLPQQSTLTQLQPVYP